MGDGVILVGMECASSRPPGAISKVIRVRPELDLADAVGLAAGDDGGPREFRAGNARALPGQVGA